MIGPALTIFLLGQLKIYRTVASAQSFKSFSLGKMKLKEKE